MGSPVLVAAGGTVPTVAAALIAAGAAVLVGGLNYFSQNRVLKEQREQLQLQIGEQREQLQLQMGIAREGQLTERFTRAVDQLGNDKPDVRLGGIYALEQIAKSSRPHRRAIFEVLTAFVQVHARWPPLPSEQPAENDREDMQPTKETDPKELQELRRWAPDVQAAMTVLGRRTVESDDDHLNLQAVDLRRASLRKADLQHANLRNGCLQRIAFEDAKLQGVSLFETRLEGADLQNANLSHATLRNAHLQHANVRGADLRDADLTGAHFQGAWDSSDTHWPEGFIPSDHGVVREERRG